MRKSITFIDQYSAIGGGQTVLLAMIESCLEKDWQVTLVAPTGGKLAEIVSEKFGASVRYFDLYEMKMRAGSKGLRDVFELVKGSLSVLKNRSRLLDSSLIHTNGARLFPAVALLSFLQCRRFFYHVHLEHSRTEKKLIKFITGLSATAGVFVNSEFIQSRFELSKKQSRKWTLAIFGLNKKLSHLEFTNRFNEPLQKHVLVLGRLAEEKGQALICEAAKHLPQIRFYLVGDADFQSATFADHLRRIAPNNVYFLGKSDNVLATVNDLNAPISVVPSQWDEPFGLVAVESMALSMITLTTGRGGLKEIANATGSQVFSDASSLVDALTKAFNSPAKELEARAKDEFSRAQSSFGWDKFDRVFQEALSNALIKLN